MAAKRISVISILTALILIASFAAAFLPQAVSPQPVLAATYQQAFTTVGTTTWTVPTNVTSVTVLVVAGGGGGGGSGTLSAYCGGGGGAGGVLYDSDYSVTPGASITVTVGDGGTGGSGNNHGTNGNPSVFGSLTATGGGGGSRGGTSTAGYDGGSGGGGSAWTSGTSNGGSGTAGPPRQGYNGGNGYYSGGQNGAGGGGGAGDVGERGNTDGTGYGGDGGSGGDYSSIFGTGVGVSGRFASGGGGAAYTTGGDGGNAGGGAGGENSGGVGQDGQAGTANTGGGGGGAYCPGSAKTGGKGGSGVVIIKYSALTISTGSGGTITTPAAGAGTYGYAYNKVVDIAATPDSCYSFVNWTGTGVDAGKVANANAASTTITMSDNYSVQANFAINTYTLSVTPNNSGGSPYFDGSSPFNCGASATIHANTSPGYTFAGWTPIDGIANASAEDTTVSMSQNRTLTANYVASNSPPSIGTVALWTTGGSPSEVTSMTPQVEYNIKVPMTDDDTLDDLVDIVVTLYYDEDGSYSESEVPTAGNNQRCAILTWENGGSPAWTIETGSNTSWTIETSNCVEPTLSNTTGTFEFHFKPGKLATRTTGDAKWHIYVLATDSMDNTDTGTKQNLTMNWYGEIIVNTASVDWGEVSPGLEFADSSPSRESDISVTYISNGAYDQQVKSSATWTDGGSNTATLNTDGTPGANEFSIKADNDNTLDGAILVTGSYATFNSITYAFGKALDFNGSDNKVTTSSTVPTNTFTFEAWVKAVNTHQVDTELDQYGGVENQCYVFGAAHRGSNAGAGLSVGTNGISVYEHGDGYMPPVAVYDGTIGTGWNHIAIVYNSKSPSIYLNGNLVRTVATATIDALYSANRGTVYAPYEIGLGSYGGFEGLIDEVRVWDVARTQQQIRDNMYSELPDPTSEADLTGYWKFNSDVLDSSGNNNNGSLSDPAPSYADNTLTGTTSESGNTETGNSLWLSIGTPFTKATYSGTIYYQIAQ